MRSEGKWDVGVGVCPMETNKKIPGTHREN